MRYIGLDVGERRIGIAVSDLLGWTAQPLETWKTKGMERDILHIRQIAREKQATGYVVGLPKNMDGTIGFQAQYVQNFVEELLREEPLPVEWIDERLTSVQAHSVLREGGFSEKQQRGGMVDRIAAVMILQTFLDKQSHLKEETE